MKADPEQRAVQLGEYIAAHNATVRAAAAAFGCSKSTVHKDVAVRLRTLQPELFRQVRAVLARNKAERHLRGGAAMVVAALAANGTTTLSELQHIDRGYERLEQNLCRLGAEITRIHQPTGATEYEGQNKTQNLEYQTG